GRAEGREFRAMKCPVLCLLEKLDVFGIGARPSALDEVDAECIQTLSNAQFVGNGERHPFTLRTVAQGRVVDFDIRHHAGVVLLYCSKERSVRLQPRKQWCPALAGPQV